MKKFLSAMSASLLFSGLQATLEPVDYVNPYMGNISHVLKPTYPTVQLPNSILRIFPRRASFADLELEGLPLANFAHRNMGKSLIEISVSNEVDTATTGYPKKYFYDQEKLTPYSYSVFLEGVNVGVRFAPSQRSAIYEFDFSEAKDEDRQIKIYTLQGSYAIIGDMSGKCAIVEHLPRGTRMYISLQEFDREIKDTKPTDNGAGTVYIFDKSVKKVSFKYGISFIDASNAHDNLKREIPDFDLDKVAAKGRALWNEKLSKIKVKGDENEMRIFYTSLWRNYERMVDFSEYGQHYNPFDKKVHKSDKPFYADDWIWDTYRTSHPLRILIEPEMEAQMLNSYIAMAEASAEKWLPTFPQITGDNHAMNGNHAVIAFADAFEKNLKGVDFKKAYELCKNTLETASIIPWYRGAAGELDKFYEEHGFFPGLREGEGETAANVNRFERRQSVAVTLGASYDDWCLAQMAKRFDDKKTYEKFSKRAKNYLNIWNENSKFFHPKDKIGKFIEPFDYRFSGGIGFRDYYDENNGYTYRYDLAFNIAELADLMGGKEELEKSLDELLTTPLAKEKRDFYANNGPDQTGNIGQFAIGNEPCFHIPYLYNYAGKPWRTQKFVRDTLKIWFGNHPLGIPGDEDGGAMSAFVVFSQLGFYPTAPGKPVYDIGSPHFTEAELNLGGGKILKILAKNTSAENKYVHSLKFNGKEINSAQIPHSLIAEGGVLEFEMASKPNFKFGVQ